MSFDNLKKLTGGKKIIALSENGPIPDIEKEVADEAVWSWWMPWYQTWNGKFVDKTSAAEWKKCMGDARVITLDDMQEGWQPTSIGRLSVDGHSTQAVYDIQGRCLSSIPNRGLFIMGGKI